MGGGDLNLKKSWHPNTMKNQERVWKAEKEKLAEDRKIADLERELKEERLRENLEKAAEDSGKIAKKENKDLNWMYKGPTSHVSREEYLLGRKIDKTFDMIQKEEQKVESQEPANKSTYTVEHDINPESVLHRPNNDIQVDMRRKLLEDPLLAVRKREEETKREITSNPVKMKQLQMLVQSLKSDKKKKKKKKSKDAKIDSKKKKKKEKKEKRKLKIKNKKLKKTKSKKKELSSSSSSSDEDEKDRLNRVRALVERETRRETELRRGNSDQKNFEREKYDRTDKKNERNSEKRNEKNSDRRDKYDEREKYDDKRERYDDRIEDKGREADGKRKDDDFDRKERRNDKRGDKTNGQNKRRRNEREVFDEDEMRCRREQMMVNAAKQDDMRKARVEAHRRDAEREEELQKQRHEADFARKVSSTSVSGSMESRIRSRVSSMQRGSQHMQDNFARR